MEKIIITVVTVFCALVIVVVFAKACMTKRSDGLKTYRAKRDFSSTPEPEGKKSKRASKPIFVVQEHDATSHHYDFRIEVEGVLVSWAVPKGPSLDPHIKHLAVRTEDHPLEYANFEGVIPEGHYGAGPVMVWDKGTFDTIKVKDGKLVPVEQCLKNGLIEIFLHGKKLQGAFAIIHMRDNQWLLKKIDDDYADARKNIIKSQAKSVKTQRTLKEIENKKKGRADG